MIQWLLVQWALLWIPLLVTLSAYAGWLLAQRLRWIRQEHARQARLNATLAQVRVALDANDLVGATRKLMEVRTLNGDPSSIDVLDDPNVIAMLQAQSKKAQTKPADDNN